MNLNDSEVEWLVGELGAPTLQFNDAWNKWLGTKGQTGSYNDRWFKYLGALSITGSLNDRLTKAFCDDNFNT